MVHGQLKSAARDAVMRAFQAGEVDVLVATSLIEVGIDVSRATVMIIEGAEHFGLAQLHQLRGRVGRGTAKWSRLLFSRSETEAARERLEALLGPADGWLALADATCELRGEGQVMGARQAGMPDLKLARLARDRKALLRARGLAAEILAADPGLRSAANAPLRVAVEDAFGHELAWLLEEHDGARRRRSRILTVMRTPELIATHTNTDLDAFAAMVAVHKLYPEAHICLGGAVNRNVREFQALHADLVPVVDPVDVEHESVRRLILVDTVHLNRLGDLADLCTSAGVQVVAFDHHTPVTDLPSCLAPEALVSSSDGALVTLLVHIIAERGILITPFEATVFALGMPRGHRFADVLHDEAT